MQFIPSLRFFAVLFLLVLCSGCGAQAQTSNTDDSPAVIELKGHASIVSSAVFSPDGKRVLTASMDNTARIWDAVTTVFAPYRKANTIAAYADYLSKYPDAPNRNIALTEMYKLIKKQNSVAGYAWFLANFADAPQAADALMSMYAEAFKAAKKENTVEALNDFIIAYPLAKETGDALDIAYALEKARYAPAGAGEREDKARMLLNKSRRIWLDGETLKPEQRLGYTLVVQRMTKLLETEFPAQKATSEMLDSE